MLAFNDYPLENRNYERLDQIMIVNLSLSCLKKLPFCSLHDIIECYLLVHKKIYLIYTKVKLMEQLCMCIIYIYISQCGIFILNENE